VVLGEMGSICPRACSKTSAVLSLANRRREILQHPCRFIGADGGAPIATDVAGLGKIATRGPESGPSWTSRKEGSGPRSCNCRIYLLFSERCWSKAQNGPMPFRQTWSKVDHLKSLSRIQILGSLSGDQWSILDHLANRLIYLVMSAS
jgi:hypothetical protein